MLLSNGLYIWLHIAGAQEMEMRQDTKGLFPLQGQYQVVHLFIVWSETHSDWVKEEEIIYSSDDYTDAAAVFETTVNLQNLEHNALNKWLHEPQQ